MLIQSYGRLATLFRIRIKLFVPFSCKLKGALFDSTLRKKMAEEGRTDPPPLFENVNITGENNSEADLFVSARQVIIQFEVMFTI